MNTSSVITSFARTIALLAIVGTSSFAFGQGRTPADPQAELAELDAAASTLLSIRSWVNSEPEAAIAAFHNYQHVRKYLDAKYKKYSGASAADRNSVSPSFHRVGDRMKAIEAGINQWEAFLPSYHEKQPKQIETELKRQRDAVERYKKSKSPRPSSFAYIPKTVWQTKDRLDVLTASGADTKKLREEQEAVQQMVLELLATLDVEQLAKKNGYVRDAYRQEDRNAIEAVVKAHWSKTNPNQDIERIVMPKASWSNTYSARFDNSTGNVVPSEVDRMTVYVATRKTESILTLQPVRLMRNNYLVNGKRLGQVAPQKPTPIATNEFPFDVLEKNIR